MELRKAYELFLREKRIDGVSSRTLEFYHWALGPAVAIEGNGPVTAIEAILWADLGQRRESIGATSVHTAFRAWRTFARWVQAEGYVEGPVKLPTIRKPKTVPKAPSVEDVRRALKYYSPNTFTGIRNALMIRVFFDTGIRLQELQSMDLEHVRIEEGLMFVANGKGQRQRWVPMGRTTRQHIWRYLKQREKVAITNEAALFVNRSGLRIGKTGIQSVFKRLAKDVGCPALSGPHKLRHGCAVTYLDQPGGDVFGLQALLGHSDLRTTQGYTAAATGRLREAHRLASPGDLLD